MAALPILEPGGLDPQADGTAQSTAERYGITVDTWQDWCVAGLPQTEQQLFNPFTVCNWLSDGNLSLSPALARRWRMYLRWFEPFVMGMRERRRIHWQRCHGFYLPQSMRVVDWRLAGPLSDGHQQCHADHLQGVGRERLGALDLWHYHGKNLAAGYHGLVGHADVTVLSRHNEDHLSRGEHQAIYKLGEQFLSHYRYGYRRHRRDENGVLCTELQPGSCLDAAVEFQRLLQQHDRPSTLVGGIIAHNGLMNPHFWLEVATTSGAVPVDITLPAIARMLGARWQEWLAAYVGGCDARRIVLSRGTPWLPMVEDGAFTLAIGELLVQDSSLVWHNAWPCIDWVCGECSGSFDHQLERYEA